MEFQWDRLKADANLRKHGVTFTIAAEIFELAVLEEPDRRRNYGEERIRAIGEARGEVLFVVYTWRGQVRRLISARRASAEERRRYSNLLAAGLGSGA